MPQSSSLIGLGDVNAKFNVYIVNRPHFAEYLNTTTTTPLAQGEIQAIGQACGNGWRKVFNVYAKLLFALNIEKRVPLNGVQSWQVYRDKYLLQKGSHTRLLFSPPNLNQQGIDNNISANSVHIIMGKTYAKSLDISASLNWLDTEFAIDQEHNLIVCPYFDYRQLSNIKIVRLVELIKQLS